MENNSFYSIVEKLRQKEIDPGEAKVLFDALKARKGYPSPVLQKQDGNAIPGENRDRQDPGGIAVIGMAGQFPDAGDVNTFWQNLLRGHNAVHELPSGYLDQKRYFSGSMQPGKTCCKWGGILAERDYFDPLFFNISPREAESMNPHQRLILQESWKALEDAGYNPKGLADANVGMFIGAEPTGYVHDSFTGASDAIIASRLSYYLDLHGPALVVNTGCSSSGAALHLACESLRNRESSLAIAGGVFASLDQSHLVRLSGIGMLSPTGRCCTFDEAADGTVISEGVGVVLLKRLDEAMAAGDHIYGLIRAWGMNQDGASNGITAPNGIAQEQLITGVYKKFGIDPEEITYIEAHGTGTKLGDPVEANALVRAFKRFTDKKQFCSVGSAKSYIGHTSGAAGIIGLIKVLLSMSHHRLPGLIRFNTLNPLIEFKHSAFYVNRQSLEWRSKNGKPLTAALNSFGHSGTNVHLVIREYLPADEKPAHAPILLNQSTPVMVPLSARNQVRLHDYAGKLQDFLKNSRNEETAGVDRDQNHGKQPLQINLAALAYTLQTGREAMEERVIFLVNDISTLMTKLAAFREGSQEIADCWQSQVKQNKELVQLFSADEDLHEAMEKWLAKGKVRKTAELWAQGAAINWELLYGDVKPQRISLPTYPFAREEFRPIPEPQVSALNHPPGIPAPASVLHPLLHQNTADLLRQRFSSTFTGQEFFLADHKVKGQRVLPGVAYPEMARAAVEQAAGALAKNRAIIRIKNVVWVRPIAIGEQPVRVHIGLFPDEADQRQIAFEIYTLPGTEDIDTDIDIEPIIHSHGTVVLSSEDEAPDAAAVPHLDMQAWQSQCSGQHLSPEQCYEAFRAMGIDYGPGHRGIEQVHVESGGNQLLAKLSLPAPVSHTLDQFVLHPSLMDSALQALIGFIINPAAPNSSPNLHTAHLKPVLPFALQELEILRPCTSAMWALVRTSTGSEARDVMKTDIDLCDDTGAICVRMKGFSSRVLESEKGLHHPVSPAGKGTLLLYPDWKKQAQAIALEAEAAAPVYAQHLVIFCEPGEKWESEGEKALARARKQPAYPIKIINLHAQTKEIDRRFRHYALRVFAEIRHLLESKPEAPVLIQVLVPNREEQQLFSGLSGLLKTARRENPKLIGQLIQLEPGLEPEATAAILEENSRCPADNWIRCQEGKRWIAGWREVEEQPEPVPIPWKDRGIYLITGGTGGLGLLFAREIARQVREATLILTDLFPLPPDRQARFKDMEALGARIVYKQADVTQKQAVNELIRGILTDFGSLNSIIHAAGVIRDNYLLKKTGEEFSEVLAPKVTGLVNLDQASKDLALDFFVFFSSAAGTEGNPGQADYCTANAFMDAYAGYRQSLAALKQRHGQTLSVDWPLWQQGGMQVNEETMNMMKLRLGMTAMETSTGIRALYRGLASGKHQVMVMEGHLATLRQKMLSISIQTPSSLQSPNSTKIPSAPSTAAGIGSGSLQDQLETALMNVVSELLKVKTEDIDGDVKLGEYGFDSITFTEFANKLNREYSLELTPTIFFEHPTLHGFAGYLLKEHQAVLAAAFAEQTVIETPAPIPLEEIKTGPSRKKPRSRYARTAGQFTADPEDSPNEPIAIIGMSGRFPMANDVNEFWENLLEGKDCISEIPGDRWDWQAIYGDPNKEINKTNIKWGGFMEEIGRFDPLFFGISPKEAELMDPGQRLLMTHAWKAIEDAGYSPQHLSGTKTGIFVGTADCGYSSLLSRANVAIEGFSSTGMTPSVGPNRMSYFLNLRGPSEPIETACSSSLVAIHRAIESIRSGNCAMAIVGGVNTIITPDLYISFNKAGMLSKDGRCKTFSNRADGYVRGEGVGMLFLKKLKEAELAGDHIYGVILSSAENHGGRANTLTSPNPQAQAELLKTAYKRAKIDPGTVSYIETHGTGTELGDPIEINGLKSAFQELNREWGNPPVSSAFCGLGSIKTNIGHLELAAGIAGVFKVLLQIKHKTLVKSLHCQTINPYIQLENSPFYIVRETREWKAGRDSQDKVLPRRAGVSSFGFGGANAHVVIEEYVPRDRKSTQMTVNTQNPSIIVLSAKNETRLKEQAQQLLATISDSQSPYADANLADMAYTLQVGREAMEERLAVTARSIKDLEDRLQAFLVGGDNFPDLHRGQVKRGKDSLAVLATDQELQKAIDAWIGQGKHVKLPDLWVRGLVFDWNKLYEGSNSYHPQRISLPTYPFAKERCWVPEIKTDPGIRPSTRPVPAARLHPLLHRNNANFYEQRFSSTFTGQEFFLADHRVKGQRMLPGVAYLEMARAAVHQAAIRPGEAGDEMKGIRLKNVVWVQPITVGEHPVQVHIRLVPKNSREIAFEITGETGSANKDPAINCRGSADLDSVSPAPTLDIKALRRECSQSHISPDQCYKAFAAMGIQYGPAHRAVEELHVGNHQVLARLSLPSCLPGSETQFVLHPSLLDSALQAALGLMMGHDQAMRSGSSGTLKPYLPFALQELEIFGNCTSQMWALVRVNEPGPEGTAGRAGNQVQKLDIDLFDGQGFMCVRMKGLSCRVLEGEIQIGDGCGTVSPQAAENGTVMLVPVWDSPALEKGEPFPSPTDRLVMIGGDKDIRNAIEQRCPRMQVLEIQSQDTIEAMAEKLEILDAVDHILWIAPGYSRMSAADDALIEQQRLGVSYFFRFVKALLRSGHGTGKMGWSVITTQAQPIHKHDPVNPTHASLHGLIGSMAREYPHWKVRLIDLEAGCDWPLEDIFTSAPDPTGNPLVYRNRQWYVQQLIPLDSPQFPAHQTLYRTGGVYVVIGGAGGLGEVWSEYMIRTYQANIIWIGRRKTDAALQDRLEKLADPGPAPLYIAADASDNTALLLAYKEIKQRFPRIHGVIHSAIVLIDQGLANMEEEQLQAGLTAKVDVSVQMARVFQGESLDFVLFFSSMIAFTKNPGQGNYAAGCTFKDAFALRLSQEWSCAVKVINWGYWGSVGIVASDTYQDRMARAGIGSIESPEAMQALEILLAGPLEQLALIKTTSSAGLKGLNIGNERIHILPEHISPHMEILEHRIAKPASPVQTPPSMQPGKDMPLKELDPLLCKLLLGQLQSIGLFTGQHPITAGSKVNTGLLDLYRGWLEESVRILVQAHVLQEVKVPGEPDVLKVDPGLPDLNSAWKEWDRKKSSRLENPGLKAYVVLVEKTLRALPDILTGKRPATDIMFPNSSLHLVEGIYKQNPAANYFNEVLADAAAAYIQERLRQDPGALLRILEIGAGTGGTSAAVFEKLRPYRDHIREYCYTDVSSAFLIHAQNQYAPENPFLTYHIFNVEKPIAGQGIDTGEYDIVIASNVLHATRNIRSTLRNTKAVLRKNGILLVNELSSHTLFAHLTFGLLEGWWLYEDPDLRITGCPGLAPAAWQEVLKQEGFQRVLFLAPDAHNRGQQVIAAGSNGIIRQKQPVPIDPAIINSNNPRAAAASARHFPSDEIKIKPMPTGAAVTEKMMENHVREIIIEKLSESLKVEPQVIDDDESFADYGLDSITGVQLVQDLNQTLAIELETTSLFDYSSVKHLTAYILSRYREIIAAGLREKAKPIDNKDMNMNDMNHESNPGPEENQPVRSFPGRFLETGVSGEPGSELKKEDMNAAVDSMQTKIIQKGPIAIIGMSGRFAGSKTVHRLWEHLATGTDLVEEVTRWDLSRYYPDSPGQESGYCHHGSFLEDIDQFDPLFFNISGLEATYMDPQQRFFLEECWQALEDAGYAGATLQGHSCGVFVGCGSGDYQQLFDDHPPAQAFWGNAGAVTPARISYYLNLQGPAVAIDTACSSSLVAIHLACQGLWTGETQLALAGGVFIQATPGLYLSANRAGMLSPSGRCHTFDQRADGFVPGEGVGVLVLKRFKEAYDDGDHIYGIIKGSAVNQDGTTNGITAPSSNSQERLQRQVYDTFNIDPQQIGMVEAHGTGTILGDPIEFQALTRSFAHYTDKKEYCAIGSIKTNIGHTQIAAGMAGVLKILLSFMHKKIPPSLHFQSGNANISFKDSPFYVNTGLKEWNIEPDQKRCAAISSFGFSGTNAHIVIEEAPQQERRHPENPGYLMVLSARTFQQLRQQANRLVEFCQPETGSDCGNISYTLLTGRKHLAHRLACVVRSREEMVTLLEKWLEKGKVAQIYVSELHENEQREHPPLKHYGNQCIRNCRDIDQTGEYWENLAAVAELYIQGYSLDYEQLFSDGHYSRISLPTYPFARESYWIPGLAANSTRRHIAAVPGPAVSIHPLLQQNTSDLYGQRYSSTFTGREFFLADHIVKGQRVLPGVAYLEMARAAVARAASRSTNGRESPTGIRLKNVVWIQPITTGNHTGGDQAIQVHIGLFPKNGDSGQISYEIYSKSETEDAEPVVHSQGSAVLGSTAEVPTLDLRLLKSQCNQTRLSPGQCYDTFRSMGILHGPGYRGVEEIYVGPGKVLAKLSLPACVSDTGDQYVLHPSLMDSALQASIGLIKVSSNNDDNDGKQTGNSARLKPLVPFTLQELEISGTCTTPMWALVQTGSSSTPGDKVQKLDIDLCDDLGKICVRMKGFSSRILEGEPGQDHPLPAETTGALMLRPVWNEQTADYDAKAVPPTLAYARHLVILCEPEKKWNSGIVSALEKEKGKGRLAHTIEIIDLHCLQEGEEIDRRFQYYALRILQEIQGLLKDFEDKSGDRAMNKDRVLIQVVVPNRGEQQLFSGLSGLLKTAGLENPKLCGQVIEIEIDPEESGPGILEKLVENSRYPHDNRILYQDGKRYTAGWNELAPPKEQAAGPQPSPSLPWKDRGVYLITGGAGGLGMLFAGEIARQVKNPTLVLMGRSPLNREKQNQLNRLKTLPGAPRVEYKQVDVTRKPEVTGLIRTIREDFGKLNGIIHAAGVIRDNYISRKTGQELEEVLGPKVQGLVNLDQASQHLALDFFVLFSSTAGSLGNIGQADYSTANAFMDAYAGYRHHLVTLKQRHGQTLSINWPLWKEGAMRITKETRDMIKQRLGMVPMQTSIGMRAFYQALDSGKIQVMVMEGYPARMKQRLFSTTTAAPGSTKPANPPADTGAKIDADSLADRVKRMLMRTVAKILKIKIDGVDDRTRLDKYGFDSITLTEFANQLNRQYKLELTPTIFFEYPTLQDFAEYLTEEHREVFAAHFSVPTGVELPGKETPVQAIENQKHTPRFTRNIFPAPVKRAAHEPEPVAIIGMSGRFPMAGDVNEFWRNLVQGKDCITEIPPDRWDWREYYGDPGKEANKTNIKWGGFIEGVDRFDPLFFGISPREARLMDPGQRLLMTYAWKAIEDAGYSAQSLWGTNTGIFVGTGLTGYNGLIARANIPIEGYSSTGIVSSVGPNRMSYFLNIHGPSEPIETACSSSLVAVHRAMVSMMNETCDMAIVGGINTILTPEAHISFNKAGMLCEDGRCKTFSNRANGYVRGEGVGMLFLKKLDAAVQAGDHIYAVIGATAENHGGRANSLTAPNPRAQAELLKTVYSKAGIDPGTLGYIEAHGTGTELGDPIEIDALKSAFNDLYRTAGRPPAVNPHCGLGSVKSNIGHLEFAAGIAGMIKVLLQLKHKTLVKTLHCDTVNPYIQLQDTPFYIVRESKEWKPLQDSRGNVLPRRAGVSSFGFGGANAHVVLEEYIPAVIESQQIVINTQNPAIILFSANNEERLREQAQQLLTAIAAPDQLYSDSSLADMAYTLQVGREALEERLAMIVSSIKELQEKLVGFLEEREDIENLYRGQVMHNKDTLSVFTSDDDLAGTMDTWITRRKYSRLLDLWVKGLTVDWNKLYSGNAADKPRRISLPTYAFANERYWVPQPQPETRIEHPPAGPANPVTPVISGYLHPLLHQNTSDLSEQRFSSTFTGREFFLADHVVKGQRVMPGVAYLEMARAAVNLAAGTREKGPAGIRLKNVVWARPIAVGDQPVRVHIGIYPGAGDSEEIGYEIYSSSEEVNTGPTAHILHSQGTAVLNPGAGTANMPESPTPPSPPTLDLSAWQARCNQGTLSSQQCLDAFKAMGIDYGPGHRGIEKVAIGPGLVLAKLSLPAHLSDTGDQFVLHPGLMDSAWQASIGLMMAPGDSLSGTDHAPALTPSLPYALEELEIHGNCTPRMWALIRPGDSSLHSSKAREADKTPPLKLDIDLCDESGTICVRMKGFSTRSLPGKIQTDIDTPKPPPEAGETGETGETHMLIPVWDAIPIPSGQTFPTAAQQTVIVGGSKDNREAIEQFYPNARVLEILPEETAAAIAKKLEAIKSIDHILWIAPRYTLQSLAEEADQLIAEQNRGVIPCFRMIKALLLLGYGTRNLSWTVITIQTQPIDKSQAVHPTHAGLHGLVGSMANEYSNWQVRLIDLEADCQWPLADIFALPPDSQGKARVYRHRQWHGQQLLPCQCLPANQANQEQVMFKPGGVYVVIGGAGGIGAEWSEYMIRKYDARVVWIGRRPEDNAVRDKIDRLAALGPAPLYISADAAHSQSLHRAYKEIKKRFSTINGLIHSAIVLQDQGLANMQEEQFRAGLSAKADVSVRMAQVFHKEPLDFVLFFSSVISFTKGPGQSNYAAGCTFKDAFAARISQEWPCTVKIINWGYWGQVGIVSSEEYRERMIRAGIGSIEPPEAMEALEILMTGPMTQMALMKTTKLPENTEINQQESLTLYPGNLPGNVQNIQYQVPGPPSPMQRRKPGVRLQMKEMDRLLCKLLWVQLQSIGLFTGKNQVQERENLYAKVTDSYHGWLEHSLEILVRENYLGQDGESYSIIDNTEMNADTVWQQWDRQKSPWLANPDMKPQVILTETTLRALPRILTSKQPATDVMFPGSSMELVEGIYRQNTAADYFNEVLADIAAVYMKKRMALEQDSYSSSSSFSPWRILEIGAGTGGTSAAVFEKIRPFRDRIQEYCYTDISKAFLIYAKKKYGPGNPFLSYRVFDVEKPIAGQGIGTGEYDIVIAANVLHATKNIRRTLRNAKAALKKHGLLLINELSGNSLFTHLTFGLLPGWWRFEDAGLRIPGGPAISPSTWQNILESEGFQRVFFPASGAHNWGQQVVAAESDGLVRQKKQLQMTAPPGKKESTAGPLSRKNTSPPSTLKTAGEQPQLPEDVNLKDRMISYLKEMICDALKVNPGKMDIHKSLDTYGLDSIMVLEINNRLGQDFPGLSKTLFFEYATINDLAGYFCKSHQQVLVKLFKPVKPEPEAPSTQTGNSSDTGHQSPAQPGRKEYRIKPRQHSGPNDQLTESIMPINRESTIPSPDDMTGLLVRQLENGHLYPDDIILLSQGDIMPGTNSRPVQDGHHQMEEPVRISSDPALIHEADLEGNPETAALIADIDEKYPPVGYERLLYPYFFISTSRNKYIRLIIDAENKLIIPFLPMDEYFYQELLQYSQTIDHRLLVVDRLHPWTDKTQTRLIPLGVWQNLDINQFTLKGNKMRKLRYLADKFKKSGEVKIEEYRSQANLPIEEMRQLMIQWSESKKNIIYHSFVCMEELLQQRLPAGHRAFLTYHDKKLCSIVVIEQGEEGIYVMDQEFYDAATAPLGHMEYAIVEILRQLKSENARIFSLGITWYPFIFEDHPQTDAEGRAWLKDQNEKQTLLSRIFQQGKTNYQFKKKFGVAGEPVFAYLPQDAPFSLLLNYWPVFYQNSYTAAELKEKLEQPDNNGSSLDLMTDSWYSNHSGVIKNRSAYLQTRPHPESRDVLQRIFPFKHIILTAQGRIAEMLFYRSFPETKPKILTTIPWTTTLMHQLNNGFDVVELPDPAAAVPGSPHLFKGEMDLTSLKKLLQTDSKHVAMVGLEVLSNASGGHPVRLSHIHKLKAILEQYRLPLVLDASRIVRNALLIKQYEEPYRQDDPWDIVKRTAEQADYIVTSLSKDFAIPVGGLIATDDDELAAGVKKNQLLCGQTTADIVSTIIQALSEPDFIIDLVTRQLTFIKRLQDKLVQARVPILGPAYGHAIVIDVSRLAPGKTNAQKKEHFLNDLFMETGIRGSIHQVGKQKNTLLDQCIRLAFPLGLTREEEDRIAGQLQDFFNKKKIPDSSKRTMEVTVHHV